MKLNDTELKIIKKMYPIYEGISFYTGKKIWTSTKVKSLFMCMEIEDEIKEEFHIHKFGQFIQALESLESENRTIIVPQGDNFVYASDGNNVFKFNKTLEKFIEIIKKPIDIHTVDHQFEMTRDEFIQIKSSFRIVDGNQVRFKSSSITVEDMETKSSNKFVSKKNLSDKEGLDVFITAELFDMMIPDDYEVSVQNRVDGQPPYFIKFKSKNHNFYYIFVESTLYEV